MSKDDKDVTYKSSAHSQHRNSARWVSGSLLCGILQVVCVLLFLSQKVGDVTILVNNAAVVHGKSLMDSDDDALLKSQHINTMGQFWVRQHLCSPHKRQDIKQEVESVHIRLYLK